MCTLCNLVQRGIILNKLNKNYNFWKKCATCYKIATQVMVMTAYFSLILKQLSLIFAPEMNFSKFGFVASCASVHAF